MKNNERMPGWFAWIVDRGVIFWRMVLLIAGVAMLLLVIFIHGRLTSIEKNLGFPAGDNTPHVVAVDLPSVIAKGQTVFVPAYSHVYHQDGKPFLVTVTLCVHNTDREVPIVITSADYFGTDGKLIKQFVPQPQRVAPLSSAEFLVSEKDTAGGSGAKFVVRWVAEKQIHEPVIQTVMIGTSGGQGLSLIGEGVVLEEVE